MGWRLIWWTSYVVREADQCLEDMVDNVFVLSSALLTLQDSLMRYWTLGIDRSTSPEAQEVKHRLVLCGPISYCCRTWDNINVLQTVRD
jgi:hypothetical protein